MYLPAMIGFAAVALSLAIFIWIGYLAGVDIQYPAFLYRSMIVSAFAGIAGYGWAAYMLKLYYHDMIAAMLDEIDNLVVEAPEIPESEIERVAGVEDEEVADEINL